MNIHFEIMLSFWLAYCIVMQVDYPTEAGTEILKGIRDLRGVTSNTNLKGIFSFSLSIIGQIYTDGS